ncbi:hypothetical protein [Labilithrix luteola]|uniref:hypothetical protein n=1 Tax=Labilithrix luteola TaxID=1391654 RepID=UPI0011BA48AB|nr:hypothetical protein [Labilithrix luteola]
MFGLLLGALQLFALVNASVRSIAGKWMVGTVGAVVRIFLLFAVTMANARIRGAGAEPSQGYFVALYLSPALSFVIGVLSLLRQRKETAGTEAASAARQTTVAWFVVTAVDIVFVVTGLIAHR